MSRKQTETSLFDLDQTVVKQRQRTSSWKSNTGLERTGHRENRTQRNLLDSNQNQRSFTFSVCFSPKGCFILSLSLLSFSRVFLSLPRRNLPLDSLSLFSVWSDSVCMSCLSPSSSSKAKEGWGRKVLKGDVFHGCVHSSERLSLPFSLIKRLSRKWNEDGEQEERVHFVATASWDVCLVQAFHS